MSRLALTFACCRYDRMDAIREGDVVPAGIELNCIPFRSGREIFDRVVGGHEFDVAELWASEFISLMGRGDCPFVALPVFPSRVFRHGYIFINTRLGIRTAKDLEGKRVGLPLYTQTAAIWVRGHLMHEFNVDLATIRWVEGAVEKPGAHGSPHAPALLRSVQIERNTAAEPLGAQLARGAIDAGSLSAMLPWLIDDVEEIDELFDGDAFPYGIEANRATLQALIAYMVEQDFIARPIRIEDLFVPLADAMLTCLSVSGRAPRHSNKERAPAGAPLRCIATAMLGGRYAE